MDTYNFLRFEKHKCSLHHTNVAYSEHIRARPGKTHTSEASIIFFIFLFFFFTFVGFLFNTVACIKISLAVSTLGSTWEWRVVAVTMLHSACCAGISIWWKKRNIICVKQRLIFKNALWLYSSPPTTGLAQNCCPPKRCLNGTAQHPGIGTFCLASPWFGLPSKLIHIDCPHTGIGKVMCSVQVFFHCSVNQCTSVPVEVYWRSWCQASYPSEVDPGHTHWTQKTCVWVCGLPVTDGTSSVNLLCKTWLKMYLSPPLQHHPCQWVPWCRGPGWGRHRAPADTCQEITNQLGPLATKSNKDKPEMIAWSCWNFCQLVLISNGHERVTRWA